MPEPLKTVKNRIPHHSQATETSEAIYANFVFQENLNIH